MTIPQSHRPGLRFVILWYGHWRLGTKMYLKKKLKDMVTGGLDQKPDWKEKWPGLSDSDMVTGGFIVSKPNSQKKFKLTA